MKKNKDFFIFINSLNRGGAERIASEFSLFLEDNNYKVYFLLTDNKNIKYKIPQSSEIVLLPLARYMKILFPLVIVIQSIYIRFRFGTNFQAISFLHRANIVNGLSSAFSNRKLVISERSLFSKSYQSVKYNIMWLLLKLLFINTDKIISISRVVKNELIDIFNVKESKIEIIHNPININEFTLNIKKKPYNTETSDSLKLCSVSRLIESKRMHIVIDLFNKIHNRIPNSELHILGEGKSRLKLIEYANTLGLKNNIIFHGNVDNVNSIINSFDFFLFASSYESFGNVALEAISSGLPVIYSSNLDSFSEIFSKSNAISHSFNIKLDDTELNLILKFISSFNYEIFKQERLQFLKRFNTNVIFNSYLKQLKY